MKKVSSLALGSSMLILSMLPAASAFAQSAPTVTLTESGYNNIAAQVQPGQPVTFNASASGVSQPRYEFWVENPNGQWKDMQSYSSNSSFTLTPSMSGDYLVTAYVLSASQLATGDYSAATNVGPNGVQQVDGVFVDSNVTLNVPTTSVVAGQPLTVSATATGIYDALYQFWYKAPNGQWYQSGNYHSTNSFTFTPTMSGTYTFIAYAKSPLAINDPEGALYSKNTGTVTVLPVVQVGLSDSASSLPNDGKSTDTFTAAVTDPNGNPMSGVAVTFTTSNSGVISFASGTAATATTNANGIATVTGTAGITVGTALVTAEADLQSSAPVTITTVQGAATGISGVTVSPTVATVTASQTGSAAYNNTVYVGTAGQSETISAEIVDAQGNPVPNQMIVLQGNHVDENASVSPYRQNSVKLPGETSFTPFSASEFGEATSTASGMVSFTVENSANTTYNTMQAAPTNTVPFVSGTSSYSLPFNTYTFDAVPASETSSVTEGTALPSAVTENTLGSTYVAWWPSTTPGMALAIEPQGTSLPVTYQSQDSSTTVTVGTQGTFTVAPYFSNYASNQTNADGTMGDQAVQFEPGPLGVLEPGQSITYNLSTNGNGAIQSVFGVPLSGSGYGWSYDKATNLWYEASASNPGTNYESADVQVTISIQNSGAPAYTVSVTTPNAPTPLTLTGGDLFNGQFGVPNPSMTSPLVPALTFTTTDGLAETNSVNVTASFNNLWMANGLVSGTQVVSPASATVTYTAVQTPVSATFSPSYIQNATTINNQPVNDTIVVTDAYGNPVPNFEVALDGAIGPNDYSGYYDGPTNNNAVWVTKIDGQALVGTNSFAGTTLPDAFPLVDPGSGLLTSSNYVIPNAVPGLYSFNNSTLDVYTNAQGQITVTMQGGGAGFLAYHYNDLQFASQPVTNNQYWLGVWDPANKNKTLLNYMNIGTGTPVTAPIPISLTSSTVNLSSTSVYAGSSVTVSGTIVSPSSQPDAGVTVTASVDGVTSSTVTTSSGAYTISLTPTAATADAAVTVTADGQTLTPASAPVLTVSSDVASTPTVSASGVANGFNLTWNSVSGAATYNVYETNLTAGTSATLVENTANTATTITGLTPGDTYEFAVAGVDQYGNVAPSADYGVASANGVTKLEYGLNVVSVSGPGSSTAFTSATSSSTGSTTIYVEFQATASNPVTADYSVTDTTIRQQLKVTSATVVPPGLPNPPAGASAQPLKVTSATVVPSGQSKAGDVELSVCLPSGSTASYADNFTVTATTGAASNANGQPSAGFTKGGTDL
ncbi:MAG: hypothetical protein C7B47_16425 [Sulfobacillus thermosulfidooxidans]|uniref:Fibronectin type-III domain-containing protein n=1 Tax=Sulfobacillus thermosulfidooxidans TaxID=28034 RepID=A0A2T2WKG6_SULTH|nr:MAG: hypothetical protein C7B47_16425 [Sulfobacillus thermosulfidooxidans]